MKIQEVETPENQDAVQMTVSIDDLARYATGLNYLSEAAANYIINIGVCDDDHYDSVINFIADINNFFINKAMEK